MTTFVQVYRCVCECARCVCVRVCMREGVRACMSVFESVSVSACVRVCVRLGVCVCVLSRV